MPTRNLSHAFQPRSVAVIGASAQAGSIGQMLFENVVRSGEKLTIYAVNPTTAQIGASICYPDIASLPEVPDLGIVATPPKTVPDVIKALGEKGTKACVVITAGLTPANGLRAEMLAAAKPFGLRVIGPNCIGIQVPSIGLDASFAHRMAKPGNLAFLSQSGALVGAVVDWASTHDIGFSHVVSMGDMADVDVGDMLDYLAGDSGTSAILMYLETVSDPRKFLSAARSASRAKPVIVVKSGRHAASAQAAHTHTGALAGSDAMIDAAFRRAGVLRVGELNELFLASEALSRTRPLKSGRVAILTNGGGAGVLAVDRLMDLGGELAELAPDTLARLDSVLPANWSKANPIDIIGDADEDRFGAALDIALDDRNIDALLVINCPTALASPSAIAHRLISTVEKKRAHSQGRRVEVLTNWLGDAAVREARKAFSTAGISTYGSPADAVQGIDYLVRHAQAQEELKRVPPSLPVDFSFDAEAGRAIADAALEDGRTIMSEAESKKLLEAFGIATVPTVIAADGAAAAMAAEDMLRTADRVVIKIFSHDITHKSDIGGVRLDIRSPEQARRVTDEMMASIAKLRPDAKISGVSVQPMVERPHAHELILGVFQDEIFGPAILFGAGGTSVEVVADRSVALPPLDLGMAQRLVAETRVAALLKGYRDRAPVDMHALTLSLVRLSQMIVEVPQLKELDINPLLCDADGVIALDARVVLDPAFKMATGDACHGNVRLAIRPYPSKWERRAKRLDGVAVFLRPVRPDDEDGYVDFLNSISREDLRLRFFSFRRDFPHDFVAPLTQIDYARAMAFVAVDETDGRILGASRFSADADFARGEYAVLVRSDLKGKGMGWLLMRQLIAYAQQEGLQEMYGHVLAGNAHMLSMCRQLGFQLARDREDLSVYKVSLDVAKADASLEDDG